MALSVAYEIMVVSIVNRNTVCESVPQLKQTGVLSVWTHTFNPSVG